MERLGGEQLSTTLDLLQNEARTFTHNIAKHHSSQANSRINELKRRVEELEKKKYDLLQQASITTVAQKIVASTQDDTQDTPQSSALCTPQEVTQGAEERKLEAFLQAYRLTGMSIMKYENGVLLIELLTLYGGRYYEAYYIEISDKGDNKVLSHHTVPYFIPIMSYYESYLAGKIHFHAFLLPVLSALNAFVSRRQQAIHAESVHKNHLNQSVATVSYDLIQLETKDIDVLDKELKFWYVVRLTYDNIFLTKPTKVRCRVKGTPEIDIAKDIKECYKSYDIAEAFSKVIQIVSEDSTTTMTTSTSNSSGGTYSSSNISHSTSNSSSTSNNTVNNSQ